MAIDVQFSAADWARVAHNWTAWWAGELPRPLVLIEVGDNRTEFVFSDPDDDPYRYTSNFPLDVPPAEVIAYYTRRLESARFLGDAFPTWWPNFGPGIMAGFVGARVQTAPDTVWFTPQAPDAPIEDLHPVYDPANIWWQRVQDLTRTAVAAWGDAVAVGHTDLGGNLDIIASLYDTQRLLLALCYYPAEVDRLVGEVTALWQRYYDELDAIIRSAGRGTTPWAAIWSPRRTYMLQSDFCYMISPQMFERFVLPDLAAMCDHLDDAFYHLDGKGQIPHLDMLLALDRLRGIQWIPGAGAPPPEEWLPLLKRIRDSGKLCQLYVSAAGARTIAREIGGQGFVLAIEDRLTVDEAAALIYELTGERQPV
jgi:5-methyltetrahydrofolate--homocysteine methyltransferase